MKHLRALTLSAAFSAAALAAVATAQVPLKLSTPNPSAEAQRTYGLLVSLENSSRSGGKKQVILGQHCEAHKETFAGEYWVKVGEIAGKNPGFVEFDFGPGNYGSSYQESYVDYAVGFARDRFIYGQGIVGFSFHMSYPGAPIKSWENTFKAEWMDRNWMARVIDWQTDTPEYRNFLNDLKFAADKLEQLKAAGVPVLFRPLHEMNKSPSHRPFWWAAQDPEHYKQLWIIVHDYMVKFRGLNNLIFVWSPYEWDGTYGLDPWAYYPGNDRVDIVGVDIYHGNPYYPPQFYGDLAQYNKPRMLAECDKMPVRWGDDLFPSVSEVDARPFVIWTIWGDTLLHEVGTTNPNQWNVSRDYKAIKDTIWYQSGGDWRVLTGGAQGTYNWASLQAPNAIPVVNPGQSFAISEDTGETATVGQLQGSDADTGTTLQNWAITGGSGAGLFFISPDSGVITVANAGPLDWEASPYSLTVTVSDGIATSAPATVLIGITKSQLSLSRSGFTLNRRTSRLVQNVTVKNNGGSAITGPIYLALDALSTKSGLQNKAGLTTVTRPAGSPFVVVSETGLPAGSSKSVTLEFSMPPSGGITYSPRFITSVTLRLDPNAVPYQTLTYLYNNAGLRTVAGQHNREPNADPDRWTREILTVTGRSPALWSGDFLFQGDNIANRSVMIEQAKQQWRKGSIVNIMWHTCSPAGQEPCGWDNNGVLSDLTDQQWTELITDGTPLNQVWKKRMDDIAGYLQLLEDAGVEVLFRPFHEMNQPAFWWAGRPGPNGTRRLYQITRDYLRNVKGLTNLIWVWNVQDFSTLASDLVEYNPGDEYWDVLSLDMYWSDGQGYTEAKYQALLNAAKGKPIAIGEAANLPSPETLAAQPRWSFFMGWAELVFSDNTPAQLQAIYNAGNVITLDEMPGWIQSPTPTNLALNRPVVVSSTESNAHPGSYGVDGSYATRWSSTYNNDQNFIVDLGSPKPIRRVRVQWEAAYARDFQIQVSNDNATWTTIQDTWGNSSLTTDYTGLNATARYVKVYCINRATPWGFSIFELEVY